MPKKRPADSDERLMAALGRFPGGAQILDLEQSLDSGISRRSLQRTMAAWVREGKIRAEGERKGRRYFVLLPPAPDETVPSVKELGESRIPLTAAAIQVRNLVRQPIQARAPVGYQRAFLDDYQPNVTRLLPESLLRHLHERGQAPSNAQPAGTYARALLDRLLIDLSWASSHLEGNTYSLLDTRHLIEEGRAAAGKDAKETQMILNHKAAIELIVSHAEEIGVNRYTILNLHAVLSDNLLDDPRQAGRLRSTPVAISASTYVPTAVPQVLEELFAQLLDKAAAIEDAFEQAFFLMVHLPYLQPFVDVNKRTSRLAANIPLVRGNLVPLSFIDVQPQIYIDGLIGIYEFNRIELLRDLFAWAYERSCLRYKTVRDSLPEPDPFRLKYREALIDTVGEIVRQRLKPTRETVGGLVRNAVSPQDFDSFLGLVRRELENLYEGNIARFRLRPGDWKAWRDRAQDPA